MKRLLDRNGPLSIPFPCLPSSKERMVLLESPRVIRDPRFHMSRVPSLLSLSSAAYIQFDGLCQLLDRVVALKVAYLTKVRRNEKPRDRVVLRGDIIAHAMHHKSEDPLHTFPWRIPFLNRHVTMNDIILDRGPPFCMHNFTLCIGTPYRKRLCYLWLSQYKSH